MKRHLPRLIVTKWFLIFILTYPTISFACPTIQVCFTPGENCTKKIVDAINAAQSSLYIQAYSFTSAPIAKAVVAAKERGLDVKVILDKSQKNQRYSSSRYLVNQSIPTWIDYKPAIAHNKIMIIDNSKIITGSFNFTSAAQNKNAENLLIIDDSNLAQKYFKNWEARKIVSTPLNADTSKNATSYHFPYTQENVVPQ